MWNVYLILIVQFFTTFNLYKIILTLFYQKSGMNLLEIGTILAFSYMAKIIFEIPSGYLADNFGRKKIVGIGLFVFVIFLVMTYFTRNLYCFIIASFLQGISLTLTSGALDAMQYDALIDAGKKDEVEKYLTYERLLISLAFGCSSLFGGFLSNISYDLVFVLSICFSLFTSIIFLFTTDNFSKVDLYHKNHNKKFMSRCIANILDSPYLMKCMNITIIISFVMIPIDDYYSLILKGEGLNESLIGIISFSQFFISSFFGFFCKHLQVSYGRNKLIDILPFTIFLFLLIFAISKEKIVIFMSYTMLLIIIALLNPIKYSIMQGLIEREYRSTIISIQSLLMALTAIISQPLFSYLMLTFGKGLTIILFILMSSLLLILNIIFFKNKLVEA